MKGATNGRPPKIMYQIGDGKKGMVSINESNFITRY